MSIVVRRPRPDFLGYVAQTVSITVERDGVVLTPTAGTYTLSNAAGASVTGLAAAAATTLGGSTSATFDIPAGTLVDGVGAVLDPSDLYTSSWSLTIDGAVKTYQREAFICLLTVQAPITDDDLIRRCSALKGDYELPDGVTSWQDYIDEAFDQMIARLLAESVHPNQITSWYAFREVCARMAEAAIARDLMVTRSGSTRWLELYTGLMATEEDPRSIEWAWAHKGYRLDRDGDGKPDSTGADESRPGNYWNNASEGGSRGF